MHQGQEYQLFQRLLPNPLPFRTPDLPGSGGTIRKVPEDFMVEEIPLYEACGEGEHLYVDLQRDGMNTRDLVRDLAHLFGISERDIGYAGLKDRHARTRQRFSLPAQAVDERRWQELWPKLEALRHDHHLRCFGVRRHRNKLRLGHLIGNRFAIRVRLDAFEKASFDVSAPAAILARLQQIGSFNFFGEQRFGRAADNHLMGYRLALGERLRASAWERRLYASALQSHLFNVYLARRHQRGLADLLMDGDIAKKTDYGGLFLVHDADKEQHRFDQGEIVYTGPLYGKDTMTAEAAAAQLEAEILTDAGLDEQHIRRLQLPGDRRAGLVRPRDASVESDPDGYVAKFCLAKGSYATVIMRELMKFDASNKV